MSCDVPYREAVSARLGSVGNAPNHRIGRRGSPLLGSKRWSRSLGSPQANLPPASLSGTAKLAAR